MAYIFYKITFAFKCKFHKSTDPVIYFVDKESSISKAEYYIIDD